MRSDVSAHGGALPLPLPDQRPRTGAVQRRARNADELFQQGYFLAVATGKSRVGLNRALNAARLLSTFDATRCADETFSKPHPAMLQELTRELGQDMRAP
jgi:phosphoglycolate phosphatase-like HAD superfamily hydrolase